MGDVKKWTVTYTKHVKQKRKVYQDGYLHLLSNNKVMLYDECEQVLDSRFLTKYEDVKSGESLAFASFLVDICDPESNPNVISHPNIKAEFENRTPEKTGVQHGQKLRSTFVTKGKPNAARGKASGINLSPSQKIIREFKKNEVLKYNVQQSPPSVTTSSFKEWEALYTTQITQKAKKYHDGFVRMVTCGSQGKQVVLFDSSRNQLDKRFLKKDEAISCGYSLIFDGYLVDIGDPIGGNEDDKDAKIDGRHSKMTETIDPLAGRKSRNLFVDNLASNSHRSEVSARQDHLRTGDSVVIELKKNEPLNYGAEKSSPSATSSSKEWEALYTTQVTQKAKKYHDGFIRIVICGSHGRQVMLFDSSKNQLDKRFLKKDEDISSGQSLAFGAYLVDIGDPTGSNEDGTDDMIYGRSCKMTDKIDTLADNLVSNPQRNKVFARQNHLRPSHSAVIGQPQHDAGSNKLVHSNLHGFGVDEMKRVPSHIRLRDAHNILSILKKPVAPDRTLIVEEAPVVQCRLSQSTEKLDSACKQVFLPVDPHPERKVVEKYKPEKAGNEGYTKTSSASSQHDDSSTSTVDAESRNNNVERPISTQGPHGAKSNAIEPPNKRKHMSGSGHYNGMLASLKHGSSVILESSIDFRDSLSSVSSETGSHHNQPRTAVPKSKEQSASTLDKQGPKCSAEAPGDIGMSHSQKMEPNKILDCPSFDLGF